MARQDVTVPDLGDFKNVEIVEVSVKVGDTVRAEQPLITLETDKAAMEVPSPAAGQIIDMKVGLGARVSKGDLICVLEVGAAQAKPAPPKADSQPVPPSPSPTKSPPAVAQSQPAVATRAQPAAATPRSLPPIDEATFARAHASPSIRKFARELGVDLGRVRGSGPKGRVLIDDVKAFVKAIMTGQVAAGPALPRVRSVEHEKFGPVEIKPLSRVRKLSGPYLLAAWLNIPHVTQHDEADITALEARRKALKPEADAAGVKLTPLALIIRACTILLKEFPDFNSSLTDDGTALIHKRYWNVGFAADTPQGLVVPVIQQADSKDVLALARELGVLSEKARTGKIQAAEMQGGTFTVSSLGGIGGTHFTPIVNAPEVAILGVGRSQMKPVWDGQQFAPRLMLPLSLSYDHRVIDGATGVRFSTRLVALLADPDALLKA